MSKKMKLKISTRLLKKKNKRNGFLSKQCRFCAHEENLGLMDYKNATFLRSFLTERGKILSSRISGNCAMHQRALSCEVKKARGMALLPYCAPHF